MNLQRIEIINEELGIGACEGEDIPQSSIILRESFGSPF